MAITAATVKQNYQEVLEQNTGAEFVKVDLHVHTPASGDAQWKTRYNFKFNIKNIPASLEKAKKLAGETVDGILKKKIRLIAVTDHNTPSDTHPLNPTNSWYELLRDAVKAKGKEKELTILPGVEISTNDLHILVILDPKEGEPPLYTTHRIHSLLQDCKFSLSEHGDYRATGMSSLFDVLEYIEDLGTTCIAIPAHIDGGNKALLEVHDKPSNVYRKLLNHPNMNVVEIVKDTTPDHKKMGKRTVREYFEHLRDKDRSPIAFIQDSDGHYIKAIGKRFSYIRMGQPDFWSLRNALENAETRVQLPGAARPGRAKTSITGIAFKTGRKWDYLAFNSNLNCVIGKRRTHKSTVINLILYGLDRFDAGAITPQEKADLKRFAVNVFISKGAKVFCYSRDKMNRPPSIFSYNNGSFKPARGEPDIERPRKYNHKVIEERFAKSTKLMDFLDKHVFINASMKPLLEKRDKYLQKVKDNNFTDCADDMQELGEACQRLCEVRKNCKEPALEKYVDKYGKKRFKVKVDKGTWKGTEEDNFFDEATLSVLIGDKYKALSKLSTGEWNAAIMVLLMNQEASGPLIIDEPEQHLDVVSMTGMLIPRMAQLKTQQQIICVTRDEHILFSGDAEQVIVTQSEKELKVISGDIHSKQIQEQILEIFEGDRVALKEKNRKLERILG
jgi:hypothetical protein